MAELEEVLASTSGSPRGRTLGRILGRYASFRIVRFAAATGTGFLVNEAILVAGIFAVFHTATVPGFMKSSFTLLGLDAVALGGGDTVAFVINERVTVPAQGHTLRKGQSQWLTRWSRYQIAAFLGNLMIAGVQLVLFATISLFPALGSIVGALVSYPVTYAVSMRFVWGVTPFRGA